MRIFTLKTESANAFRAFIDDSNLRMSKAQIGVAFMPLVHKVFYNGGSDALIVLAFRTTIPNIVPSFFLRQIIKRGLKKASCQASFISHKKALEFLMGDAL